MRTQTRYNHGAYGTYIAAHLDQVWTLEMSKIISESNWAHDQQIQHEVLSFASSKMVDVTTQQSGRRAFDTFNFVTSSTNH